MKTQTTSHQKMSDLVHRIWQYKPLLFSCLILLALAFSFGSCQKKTESIFSIQNDGKLDTSLTKHIDTKERLLRTTAEVVSGDEEFDGGGIPWYLQVSATERLYPTEIPREFQISGIVVQVSYRFTNIPVPASIDTRKFKIKIVSIKKVYESAP